MLEEQCSAVTRKKMSKQYTDDEIQQLQDAAAKKALAQQDKALKAAAQATIDKKNQEFHDKLDQETAKRDKEIDQLQIQISGMDDDLRNLTSQRDAAKHTTSSLQVDNVTLNREVDKLKNQLKSAVSTGGVATGSPTNIFKTPIKTTPVTHGGAPKTIRQLGIYYYGKEQEDYMSFRDQYATAIEMHQYCDETAKFLLKLCMKGSAARAVLRINHKDDKETVTDVLLKYDDIFMHKSASDIAITQFSRAEQQPKETIMAFHSRLGALFLRAYPDLQNVQDLVIRVFSNGLRKTKVKEAVMRAKPVLYEEALEAALLEQAVYERVYPAAMDGAAGYEGPDSKRGSPSDTKETMNEVTASTECYGCGKRGHIRAMCPTSSSRGKPMAVNKVGPSGNRPRTNSKDRKAKVFQSKRTGKLYRRVSHVDMSDYESELEELEEVTNDAVDTDFEEEPRDDDTEAEDADDSGQDFLSG